MVLPNDRLIQSGEELWLNKKTKKVKKSRYSITMIHKNILNIQPFADLNSKTIIEQEKIEESIDIFGKKSSHNISSSKNIKKGES